jgi:hypothetical protein
MSIKIDTLAQDSLLQDLDTADTAAVVGGGGYAGRRGGYPGGGYSIRVSAPAAPVAPAAPAAPAVSVGYVPGTYTSVNGNTIVSGGYSSAGGSATGIATGTNASSFSTFVAGSGFGSAAIGGSSTASTGAGCGGAIPAYLGD